CVPCTETARVQEGHILIGHWLCEALDEALADS
ncbi:phosphoheptose isomerase, partial [Enterococcus hirae]